MTASRSARAIADISGGIILATVEIAAPPERVFRALTRSDEIIRWWGSPESYRTESWMADLRVGGAWKAEGRSADGMAFSVSGEFLEVDPPHRLVQTWKADWDGGQETKLTYQLAATDIGTKLTVRHEGFAGRPESCEQHTAGWEAVLGWLARHVEPTASADGERFFLCRLLPPRASFVQDMTAEEAAIMQEHGAYWRESLRQGVAIIFGPVADPQGPWGLGVVRVKNDEQMRNVEANDPAIRSGKGFRYEVLPMIRAVVNA